VAISGWRSGRRTSVARRDLGQIVIAVFPQFKEGERTNSGLGHHHHRPRLMWRVMPDQMFQDRLVADDQRFAVLVD
jgi:hypothetical protein